MKAMCEAFYMESDYAEPTVNISIKIGDKEKGEHLVREIIDAVSRKIKTNLDAYNYEAATNLGILREDLIEALGGKNDDPVITD